MAERPEDNPYGTDTGRQRAITKRLVIVIGLLGSRLGAARAALYGLAMNRTVQRAHD
jgi:hypothetical protein